MIDINDFYSTFFSSDPKNVTTLDLENTFKIDFKFYPLIEQKKSKPSFMDKVGSAIAGAAKNLLQNASGGLLGGDDAESVKKLRKDAKNDKSALTYITKGVMIGDGSDTVDLTPFVEQIQTPNIVTSGVEDIATVIGNYSVTGYFVEPDNHEIVLTIRNTKLPILETVFYPWMRETTTPYWNYDKQPYTTATITVNMKDHVDLKYIFYGCYPIRFVTYDPTMQLNSLINRDVTIKFLYMAITSKLKSKDDIKDKLKSLGNSLINGAGGMLGM